MQLNCIPPRSQNPTVTRAAQHIGIVREGWKALKNGIYHYNSLKALGEGAFGTVYMGKVKATNDNCAVKAIPLQKIHAMGMEEDIHREVNNLMTALKLKNPFAIEFIDSFLTKTNYYIITEFCDGGTLDDECKKREDSEDYYTINQAKNIIYQIILGLSSLSLGKIVHRDIKTENIFINNGVYKIGDFGSSKVTQQAFSTMNVGTKCYCAPEYFEGGGELGCKVDVWATGCMLHRILFG